MSVSTVWRLRRRPGEEEEEKGDGGMGEVLNSFGHAFLNDGVILQKMILLSVFSSRIKWN